MSEDTEFLAWQLLGHLLGDDQAAGLAEPILTGLLTDALALADRLAGGKDASGSWLDSAFGLGGATGAGRPFRLAEVLAGFVPTDVREEIARLLRGSPSQTTPSSASNAPPAGPPRLPIDDLIRRLTDLPGGPAGALAVTALFNLHDDLWQLVAGAKRPSSSKWNKQNVVRRIRELIQYWLKEFSDQNMPGENTRRAAAEIEAEILGPFEERLFVASGLTIGGLAAYGVADLADLLLGRPSTMLIGTEVHQVLQEQYRTEPKRFNELIVQESYVYTRGVPQPLQKAALRNHTLLALWIARDSYLLKVRTLLKTSGLLAQLVEQSLRDDNINLTTGAIWEIKSIRGAFFGVLQEFTYRRFFNFFVALLKDIPQLSRALDLSGPLSFIREHLDPGDTVRWPEIVSSPVRRIGGGVSRFPAETILVLMLDPLPGLVLYLRLDLPLVAAYALARYIRFVLNEVAKRLKREFDKLVTALVFAIAVVLVILLVVALVFALVKVGVALAALLGEAALILAPLLAKLGSELPRLVEMIRRLAEQIEPLREQYGLGVHAVPSVGAGHLCLRFTLNADTAADTVPRASAMLGMLRLEDAPVEILSSMEGIFGVAGALGGALVLQRLAAQA